MAPSRAVAPLAVIALAALFLGPSIVGDRTIYVGDVTAFERPRDRLVAASFRAGDGVATWTPDIFGGVSAIGAQEMALLYPPTLLLALLAPSSAPALGVFLHVLLAAFGARSLARHLGLSPLGALLAAIVYGSGGAILSIHNVPVYVRSAGWLPWILLGVGRESTGLATLGLLGTYLGGDPMGCVVAAIASLALGRRAVTNLTLARAAPLTALLAAAQLLPALGSLGDTSRVGGYDHEYAMRFSLWPPEIAGLVVPFLFGTRSNTESVWIDAVGPDVRSWCETLYVGPIAVGLAGAGALTRGRARTAGLVLLAFVALALGRFTPLGHVFHLVSSFRYPAKLFLPATLGVALLAAHGLDALPVRRLTIGFAVLGGALLLATNLVTAGAFEIDTSAVPGLDGPKALAALAPRIAHAAFFALGAVAIVLRARRKRAALVLLAALDVAFALRPAILTAPRSLLDAPAPVAAALRRIEESDGGVPARVWPTGKAMLPTTGEKEVARANGALALEVADGLDPDTGLGDGVRSQTGFLSNEPFRWGVLDARAATLVARRSLDPDVAHAWRGARFVLATREEPLAGEVVADLGERVLRRVPGAPHWAACYPRAILVAPASDERLVLRHALDALQASGGVPVIEGASGAAPPPSEGPPRPARLSTRFEARRFELDVEGPGWLVVRETCAKGWTAKVDGAPSPIYVADVAFRAVPLGAGKKHVVFEFAAPLATLGTVLTVLGALACLVVRGRALARSAPSPRPTSGASSPPGGA